MADITWDDVVAVASELADVGDDAQAVILEFVNGFLNPAMFTPINLKNARIYLAAHVGSYSLPGGTGFGTGDVVSEEVGGIKRTYSVLAAIASGSGVDNTLYGSLYAMILNSSHARLPRVI